jgi:hypothetical protein
MTWEPTPAGVVCLSMIVRDEAAVIERALDFGHNRSELMRLARVPLTICCCSTLI